jgi:5-methylcytosine-specific restriction endonuclease McrA
MVAGILTNENKKTLLREIRGKTQRQVHVIASGYRPERTIRDRVRPVAVMRAATDVAGHMNTESAFGGPSALTHNQVSPKWQEIYRRSGGKKLTTIVASALGTTDGGAATPVKTESAAADENTFIIEQQFELGFSVSAGFMKKLDEVKALLSNRYPTGIEFEQLFEAVIDEFLDRHSPKRKQARREERKQRRYANSASRTTGKRTRYISPASKDKVFTRDGGRCTFIGANGRRCNSTWGLQIDHIEPYTRGGSNRASNLRLLCGKHNRIEAERILGVGIGSRRSKREQHRLTR